MVIEDSYIECPYCSCCQEKELVKSLDNTCYYCCNKISKNKLKL